MARLFSDWIRTKQEARKISWPILLYLAIFIDLTLIGPNSVLPIHPRPALSLSSLDRFLPLRLFFGPSPALYLKPAAVLFGLIAIAVLAWISRYSNRARIQALSLGLAYSLFYSAEYSYNWLSPSVDRVAQQIYHYLQENQLPKPLFIHGLGYMNVERKGMSAEYFTYDPDYIDRLIRIWNKDKGTVVLVEAASIAENSELKAYLHQNARLVQSFFDHNIEFGQIWTLN